MVKLLVSQGGVHIRCHLVNPVSKQAMQRDGIVDRCIHSKYTNEIIDFAAWVRTLIRKTGLLIVYRKESFDV